MDFFGYFFSLKYFIWFLNIISQFWLLYLWALIHDLILGLFFLVALDNAHICVGLDSGDC